MKSGEGDRFTSLLDLTESEDEKVKLSNLLIHIGIPPDLCYLLDGLRRTLEIIENNRDEFNDLIDASEEGRNSQWSVETLVEQISRATHLAKQLIATSKFSVDPIAWKMERRSILQNHPLNRHGISVCPHWANLFVEYPPESEQTDIKAYKALYSQVSRYVLAAQIRTRNLSFLDNYHGWADGKKNISDIFFDNSFPVSRITTASLELRRLTLHTHVDVLRLLNAEQVDLKGRCDLAEKRFLEPTRLSHSDGTSHPEEERKEKTIADKRLSTALSSFRLLHELVFQDTTIVNRRRRFDSVIQRASPVPGPQGYVRIAADDLLASKEEVDDGVSFLRLFYDPNGGESDGTGQGAPPVDSANQHPVVIVRTTSPTDARVGHRRADAGRLLKLLPRLSSTSNIDRSSLTPWQVSKLSESIHSGHMIPAHALLIATLSTGRDLRESGVRILDQIPDNEIEFGFLLGDRPAWIIHAPPPAYAEDGPTACERPTSPFILLPDYLGFRRHIGSSSRQKIEWSHSKTDSMIQWLREALLDDFLTYSHLQSFLFRRLLGASKGDAAVASIITGRQLGHSQSTRHYTALSAQSLGSHYRKALGSLAPTMHGSSDTPSTSYFGAKRVPTVNAVKQLVLALAELVRTTTGLEQRNNLTAYTLLGFHLGTAGRTTERRLIRESLSTRDLLGFHEKGSRYNDRLVAIAPRLKRQLLAYLDQLKLWNASPSNEHGLFLFWSNTSQPVGPYTSSHFEGIAKQLGFDLDVYSFRRFARTELIARGALPEDVDAHMGHWFDQLSPHDPLSTFPPKRLNELSNSLIEDLLHEVGYEVIV